MNVNRKYCYVEFDLYGDSIRINRRNLLLAIQNIKDGRDSYATQDAYQMALGTYEAALEVLDRECPEGSESE